MQSNWKTTTLSKTCLTHLTTYSVSDSVSSTGRFDLNGVPSGANSGTLAISAACLSSREAAAAAAASAPRFPPSGFSDAAYGRGARHRLVRGRLILRVDGNGFDIEGLLGGILDIVDQGRLHSLHVDASV